MTRQYTHGRFVWRELVTTDLARAKAFYGEMFNWRIEDSKMPGMEYLLAYAGDAQVAGMMAAPMPGMPSHWMGYVSVPDVDASVAAATAHGGKLLHGPMDIPSVGRMATLSDPSGAVFATLRSVDGDGAREGRPGLGEFCWEAISTSDAAATKAFYPHVTGWMLSGFAGADIFAVAPSMEGGVASIAPVPPGVPTHWVSYVAVDDLAAANARAARLGAKVLVERVEVPTVGAFSMVQDPTGAMICPFAGEG